MFCQSPGHGSGYRFKFKRDTLESPQAMKTPNPQGGSAQVHQTAFVNQVHVCQMLKSTPLISFFGINP